MGSGRIRPPLRIRIRMRTPLRAAPCEFSYGIHAMIHTLETKSAELCSSLIQIQSYSGQEGDLVRKLGEIFPAFGFDEVSVDRYGSIVGRIKGRREGPRILFDAHVDTVPVDSKPRWTRNPFGGEVSDGKVFGRGASDMKGALSAMIVAGEKFARATGGDFAGEICVAGGVHEECFEGVAAREISRRLDPDYVIIGEASELDLKIGQRGRAEIVLETHGVPAHSANPAKGIHAVYHMCRLIDSLHTLQTRSHPVLGEGILVVTDIKSQPYPGASVIPHYCRVTCDRRLLVGEDPAGVMAPLEALILKLTSEVEGFNAAASYAGGRATCYTGCDIAAERFFPGWLQDAQAPFIRSILDGLHAVDLQSQISHYSFCTNGSHYAGERGIRTVGFGPSRENLAHTVDEYIDIEQLGKAALGYAKIMEVLTSA